MASEQTRDQGSYQTYRLQATREIDARTNNTQLKDEDYLNCLLETVKNREIQDRREFVSKRAGTAQMIASVGSSEVRGMFYWEDQDKLLYAVGHDLYVYSVTPGTSTTLLNVFPTTTTGEVGMCEYLYDTNAVVVVVTDGTTLSTISTTNVVTPCADPDMPTPHLPSPCFIDGYLFLAKSGTADVYNSDLNDPLAWTPGNFISAEMRADLVLRISTLNNYLIVFGSESIEYFWDAANPTGSPLQRNDTPIKFNNYLNGYAQYGNDIYFVGETTGGQPEVFHLKDFKAEEIASYTVSRYLNTVTESSDTWKGSIVAIQGHVFYVLAAGTLTYVYDTNTKLWIRWAFQGNATFPIVYSTRVTTPLIRQTVFALKGNSSAIYLFSDALYQDVGVNYTFKTVTDIMDFGTMNNKMMARFSIVADEPNTNTNILVSWTDDDYKTYSTARVINLNQELPSTYRLGRFRQRAFKLEYTDNFPFRFQKYEVDINKGIS